MDHLRLHFTKTKLVVLTEASSESLLSAFVFADVDAILPTQISGEVLVRSLELVLCDLKLFPAGMLPLFAVNALGRLSRDPAYIECSETLDSAHGVAVPCQPHAAVPGALAFDPPPSVTLSSREQQIVDCIVRGLSNKHIARELKIAEATVKVHVKSLLRKIRVDNRTQVAIWALRQFADAA